jgi:hypothetical protein
LKPRTASFKAIAEVFVFKSRGGMLAGGKKFNQTKKKNLPFPKSSKGTTLSPTSVFP